MAEHPDEPLQRAVVQAAETLNHEPYAGERLYKAADLVLTGGVTLHEDGTATVKSGSHTYEIDPRQGCTCEDARRRSKWCKHTIAVELFKRTKAIMEAPDDDTAPPPPAEASPAAAWPVSEAQASCCLKFHLGGVECLYTMRDINDDLLFARVRRILPKLLAKANGNLNGASPPPQPETPRCPIHNTPMRRHTKGDQAWYSHKAPDGSWCRGT
jgi:hypothetical protein